MYALTTHSIPTTSSYLPTYYAFFYLIHFFYLPPFMTYLPYLLTVTYLLYYLLTLLLLLATLFLLTSPSMPFYLLLCFFLLFNSIQLNSSFSFPNPQKARPFSCPRSLSYLQGELAAFDFLKAASYTSGPSLHTRAQICRLCSWML